MARIAGVELEDKWKLGFALTKIKGIGWSLSKKIIKDNSLDPLREVSTLTAEEIAAIVGSFEGLATEGDLVRKVRNDIQRLKTISSYRGVRHTRGLPSRGQRTKSNARTKRGKRKTVGAFKKEALTKMQQNKKES